MDGNYKGKTTSSHSLPFFWYSTISTWRAIYNLTSHHSKFHQCPRHHSLVDLHITISFFLLPKGLLYSSERYFFFLNYFISALLPYTKLYGICLPVKRNTVIKPLRSWHHSVSSLTAVHQGSIYEKEQWNQIPVNYSIPKTFLPKHLLK